MSIKLESMLLQKLAPQNVKEFIKLNMDYVRLRFPEPSLPDKSRGGATLCGQGWVIVILFVIDRLEEIVWRNLPAKLPLSL